MVFRREEVNSLKQNPVRLLCVLQHPCIFNHQAWVSYINGVIGWSDGFMNSIPGLGSKVPSSISSPGAILYASPSIFRFDLHDYTQDNLLYGVRGVRENIKKLSKPICPDDRWRSWKGNTPQLEIANVTYCIRAYTYASSSYSKRLVSGSLEFPSSAGLSVSLSCLWVSICRRLLGLAERVDGALCILRLVRIKLLEAPNWPKNQNSIRLWESTEIYISSEDSAGRCGADQRQVPLWGEWTYRKAPCTKSVSIGCRREECKLLCYFTG